MEILVIVRLCCNCTYGEVGVGSVASNSGAGGERCCGDASLGLAVLAKGWRLRRALQPEVGSVFVPGSIESSWLRHMQPRARVPHGAGGSCRRRDSEGLGWAARGPLCLGCAAGMAIGRGPRLLAGGCDHRGVGAAVSPWLGRRGTGHPCRLVPGPILLACGSWAGRTVPARSPAFLPCAGTSPPGALWCFACACSDEGPSSLWVRGRGKRGTPCLSPPSRSRGLAGSCREWGSDFPHWHGGWSLWFRVQSHVLTSRAER